MFRPDLTNEGMQATRADAELLSLSSRPCRFRTSSRRTSPTSGSSSPVTRADKSPDSRSASMAAHSSSGPTDLAASRRSSSRVTAVGEWDCGKNRSGYRYASAPRDVPCVDCRRCTSRSRPREPRVSWMFSCRPSRHGAVASSMLAVALCRRHEPKV